MTKQLNYLSTYVPHNVFCEFKTVNKPEECLNGKVFKRKLSVLDIYYLTESTHKKYKSIKPVLFPLTMINQEIEYGGEKINLEQYFRSTPHTHVDYITNERDYWIKAKGHDKWLEQIPYKNIQKLIEHKFDVHGLIEKGLAIAVTNEFNPYK